MVVLVVTVVVVAMLQLPSQIWEVAFWGRDVAEVEALWLGPCLMVHAVYLYSHGAEVITHINMHSYQVQ